MNHVRLTCINHPELRWSCKEIAISNSKYNGQRNIFFLGKYLGKDSPSKRFDCLEVVNGELVCECLCSPDYLIVVQDEPIQAK